MAQSENQNDVSFPAPASAEQINALILAVQGGDGRAFEELFVLYMPLLLHEVSVFRESFAGSSVCADDLYQEAALSLYLATMRFSKSHGASFGVFAKKCIYNKFISLLRRAQEVPLTLDSACAQRSLISPDVAELCFFERESAVFSAGLSALERRVLRYYLRGYSYAEIAQILGKDEKAVDNAMARVRRKLRK